MRRPGARDPAGRAPARIRFGTGELSGAFGDLGTDLPLLAGMILAAGLEAWRVLLIFGLLQVAAALVYRMPMPVQPLKAVAALVIAQNLTEPVIRGGAFAVAAIMAVLTLTGALSGLARLVPRPVVRGIQAGLGLKLGLLALGSYVTADGTEGVLLAGGCFVLLLMLLRRPRFPAAVAVLAVGAVYAVWRGDGSAATAGIEVAAGGMPGPRDLLAGLVVLALPQIPLSLGNSVLATKQLADDWFPRSGVTLRRIGTTYSTFNFAVGLVGGVPVCHGSGGMAGHYALGGRTGGSVLIYGAFYMLLAAAAAAGRTDVMALFPLPVLNVILAVESSVLVGTVREFATRPFALGVAAAVAIAANVLPYGFLSAMVLGGLLCGARHLLTTRGALGHLRAGLEE